MPRELAAWASSADLASLPTGLALAVRQYLGRLAQIDPASRASLGGRLALSVSEYVAPPPPPGTPPELVPRHVAVVMDGNGRWANARGLPRTAGHEAGEAALLEDGLLRRWTIVVQKEG